MTLTVNEARNILWDDAQSMSDEQIQKWVAILSALFTVSINSVLDSKRDNYEKEKD
jgi:hypothetical protein